MKKINEIYQLLKQKKLLNNDKIDISNDLTIDENTEVSDITYDSREVKDGTLFFCKGAAFKRDYLVNSAKAGAIAYVSEIDYKVDIPAIIVKDIRIAMMEIAAFFFDYPDQKLVTIGVTGTKGKTTTVKFLKSIFDTFLLKNNKKLSGLISTINTYDGINEYTSSLTTPEAIPLYKNLNNAVISGLKYMIIEVSSQALKYYRINNVKFNIGAFLNIGLDHVSEIEHPSFEDYFESKLKLIDQSEVFVYNSKMDHVETIKDKIKDKESYTFSLEDVNDSIYATNITYYETKSSFELETDVGNELYEVEEPGNFNIENALVAIKIAKLNGIDYQSIYDGLLNARVEGRNIILHSEDEKIIAWISYAHNGLSFQKSFEMIRSIYGDIDVISVFGSPGDKAKSRLTDMSTIGAQNSSYIIICPDDPGSKPFREIADEMAAIIKENDCDYEIYDVRAEGIKRAFELSKNKTLLFIAGKGEDKTDFVDGKFIEIEDDLTTAKKLMQEYNMSK